MFALAKVGDHPYRHHCDISTQPSHPFVFRLFVYLLVVQAKLRFNKDGPEKTYLNSLRGMERVQATLCEAEYMLPDESAHVFILVGEFIRWVGPIACVLKH